MKTSCLSAVIAGGGTGGHVFPALAVADKIISRGGQVRFVGTADKIEARLVPQAGYGIDFLNTRPLLGGGVSGALRGLAAVPLSLIRAAKLLRQIKPDVVFGVGGYVAGPVVLAARLIGIKNALLEQNATFGLANRLLLRHVDLVCLSYEEAAAACPHRRTRITGNPVREEILKVRRAKRPRQQGRVFVLVMGGSQGASAIDQRVPRAIAQAALQNEITVLHQCGSGNEQMVRRSYGEAGVSAEIARFIDDMAAAYAQADVVVSRAGATTISELTAVGLPAVLLPYPHHVDRQQEKNAEPMKRAHAAIVLDEQKTGISEMAEAITGFVRDAKRRLEAAQSSAALGRPEAAHHIAEALIELAGGRR